MSPVGWIVIGFIAGSISGWIVGNRSVEGCLPTVVVGIVGGLVGGWLANQLDYGPVQGFISAVVFASIGAILLRLVLRAIERR
jgi:uncharacterized membrane protein YeaQ/YmgE (transglycosylase-associated protein family)